MIPRYHASPLDPRRLSLPAHLIGRASEGERMRDHGPIQPMDTPRSLLRETITFAALFAAGLAAFIAVVFVLNALGVAP